ncbi:MAG: hypothetical protein AAB628_00850 [Patescibacteria group bacterium]
MKLVPWYLVIVGFCLQKEKETSIPLKSTFEQGAIEEGNAYLIEYLRRYGRTGFLPIGSQLNDGLALEEIANESPRVQLVRKSVVDGELVFVSKHDFSDTIALHRPTGTAVTA